MPKKVKDGSNDPDSIISQIVITPSGKSVIAGIGEEGKPGFLQVWLRADDKPLEKSKDDVQAHSKEIESIRLTEDCLHLFTIGKDGILAIFDVRDRDPRSQKK